MADAEIFKVELTDCNARLIWYNERDLTGHHLHMEADFEDVTVCWLIKRGTLKLSGPGEGILAEVGDWIFSVNYQAEQHFSPRSRIL